ncbi:MAG: flagellin FliC, partial [Actinomycetota bacterium]
MAMIINTNVSALNAQRNLSVTNDKMGKTLEKLSSGLRINRAADDAAGLAISEKMRAQIHGMQQGQ